MGLWKLCPYWAVLCVLCAVCIFGSPMTSFDTETDLKHIIIIIIIVNVWWNYCTLLQETGNIIYLFLKLFHRPVRVVIVTIWYLFGKMLHTLWLLYFAGAMSFYAVLVTSFLNLSKWILFNKRFIIYSCKILDAGVSESSSILRSI